MADIMDRHEYNCIVLLNVDVQIKLRKKIKYLQPNLTEKNITRDFIIFK